jgi:hypothetical protein
MQKKLSSMPISNALKSSFISKRSNLVEDSALSEQIKVLLESRINSHLSYTVDEINEIESLEKRLFPQDFCLDVETTKRFRALCALSKHELKSSMSITSHRKFIGPIIVAAKKLLWPLIRIHLKNNFDNLEEFSARTVETLAQQHLELAALKITK